MAIPSNIGRHQVAAELSRGGFAVIYRARDPSQRRRVAIKLPHSAPLTDHNASARFRLKIRLAVGSNHPNSIAYMGTDDGKLFLNRSLIGSQ